MKNTKLIGLVALLVVVVLVVSVVIATSADNALVEGVNKQFATYQDKIDALQSTIDKLNQGIIDANQALDELKQAGVQIESWNEATPKIPEKLAEALKALTDFQDSFKVEGSTLTWRDSFTTQQLAGFGGVLLTDEATEPGVFAVLWYNVQKNIERATSVEAMDKFIEDFGKDLEEVPTKKEVLYATIEKIEKDGVTLADYEDFKTFQDLYNGANAINDALYAPAKDETPEEKTTVTNKYNELLGTFKPLAVESFVTAAGKLPTVAQFAPSHNELYATAKSEYTFVTTLHAGAEVHSGDCKNNTTTPVGTKDCSYCVAVDAYGKITDRKAIVDVIAATAKLLNEYIESKKDFTIAANKETRDMINDLLDAVDMWTAGIENDGDANVAYKVITDKEDDNYNAELYALVNHDGIKAYNDALLAKIPELKAAADAYIAEVGKIGDVTNKSADVIKAAGDAYAVFMSKAGFMAPADADYILGNEADKGVVAAWGVYDTAVQKLATINGQITTVETAIKALMKFECKATHVDADGNPKTCDCDTTVLNVFDSTKIGNLDVALNALKTLLENKGVDETAVKSDLLAILKEAYTYDKITDAKALVAAAHNAGNKDDSMKAFLEGQIDGVKGTEFTFAVELVHTTEEGHNPETCACTYTWVKTAVENALANYTAENLANFFK